VMITRQSQRIVALPFNEILDPETGKTRVRMLETDTESFATAMSLQTRLSADDLQDAEQASRIASATKLDVAALKKRFN
jgi:hypothetical protein